MKLTGVKKKERKSERKKPENLKSLVTQTAQSDVFPTLRMEGENSRVVLTSVTYSALPRSLIGVSKRSNSIRSPERVFRGGYGGHRNGNLLLCH
jgi:hypothetical protein